MWCPRNSKFFYLRPPRGSLQTSAVALKWYMNETILLHNNKRIVIIFILIPFLVEEFAISKMSHLFWKCLLSVNSQHARNHFHIRINCTFSKSVFFIQGGTRLKNFQNFLGMAIIKTKKKKQNKNMRSQRGLKFGSSTPRKFKYWT